jgi:hypothetical protein
MSEASWKIHIGYLEGEVRKIDERADKLEALIAAPNNGQNKDALRRLLKQLRDEGTEHRKYLALVKETWLAGGESRVPMSSVAVEKQHDLNLRPISSRGNMRFVTLQVVSLAVALISCGCGSSSNPARADSTNEMTRVQTAFEQLQNESDRGASQQEYTRQVNDTLAKIGDLKTSEKAADLGLPKDKVALVYDYFRQAAIAYSISTQFVGTGFDAPLNKTSDSTSEGQRESLSAAFPELDPIDAMSRRDTLHDLLRIAKDETGDAEGMIKTL